MFLIIIITNFYFFQSAEQVETIPDDTPASYDDETDLIDLFSDDDPAAVSQLTEDQLVARDRRLGRIEFNDVIREWVKWKIPWRKLFVHLPKDQNLCVMEHMMKLPMKPVMDIMERTNCERENISGYLPLMCKNSPVQLGALSAQSFAERMISAGNLLITRKRTLLDDDLINKLIVLRMNRKFMEFMRKTGRTTLYHKRGIADEK